MRVTIPRPRFTIERLRTLVLIGGGLLVTAIVIFLAAGQWTRRFLNKDLPSRLGINIEQQADGVNYTQTRKGKTIFKIHAARAVTMKTGGDTVLHDVKIDLYGDDGNRADTISGSEFQYDPNAGVATAAGEVYNDDAARCEAGRFSTQARQSETEAAAGYREGNQRASGRESCSCFDWRRDYG